MAASLNENLAPFEFDGVTVYVCKETGSIWFPEGTLAAIKDSGEDELDKLDSATTPTAPVQVDSPVPTNCPVDNSLLLKYHYLECYAVNLEQCMECGGIWIKHTEFDKLAAIDPLAQSPGIIRNQAVAPTPANLTPEAIVALDEFTAEHAAVMGRLVSIRNLARWIDYDYRRYQDYL